MSCRPLTCVLAALVALAAEAAPFEPPNPQLDEARLLYTELKFEQVIPKLEQALKVQGVTDSQRIEIYKLMALTHSAFEQHEQGIEAFSKVLEIDPRFELPGRSNPTVRGYFQHARELFIKRQQVRLNHSPPAVPAAGVNTSVDVVATSGADRITRITLHYRIKGTTTAYSQLPLAKGEQGRFSAVVPNVLPGPAGRRPFEYFLMARDDTGAVLASVGDEVQPLLMQVDTVELSVPLYKHWGFWVTIGLVAAAAVAVPITLNAVNQPREGTFGAQRTR